MSLPPEPSPRVPDLGGFQLGDWVVRQGEGTLSWGERSARLEPRVMDVLVYLAAHPERVVSKEELIEAVWGGSFVEEGALSQAIHSLRKALGDDARQPRYIQKDHRSLEAAAPVKTEGTRIVVLPFENLGKPEDAYFADGLTEEITKDLASLLSLQVISRTSAIQYEGAHKTATQIGRELKVDYILEGTVRWAVGPGGLPRVRITPQLIRVANDSHVWAESFERQVQDIFEVQAEISRRVIAELGIALMPDVQASRLMALPSQKAG
jgi:TolB-like protein